MLRRLSRAAVLVIAALAGASCNNSDAPMTPIAFIGPDNLVITDVRVGDGAAAAAGQRIDIAYSLWLYDPRAEESKGTPVVEGGRAQITLTADSVIEGFVQGVPGMKVGGLRRLIIPPSLGYGTTGSSDGAVPPNAWTVFDVQLIAILN